MYVLNDGTVVSADQIKAAFADGKAVLVHGRGEMHSTTGLMLDGQHFDTRGECYSMWDEAWTRRPETISQALKAAHAYS
jgi:hypothetical protein